MSEIQGVEGVGDYILNIPKYTIFRDICNICMT